MRINNIDRSILRIALPAIIANATVPLLGMADTAIVGHLGSTAYIGAIAVGSLVFSVVYWLFGFLRAGTSGPTSQALGAGDREAVSLYFHRSCLFAVIIAAMLLALQRPIGSIAFAVIAPSPEVLAAAQTYFGICIWGAPAVMLTTACYGWFIGLQDTRLTMATAILQNLVNIAVSLLLVLGCGMKVEGLAYGTLAAQYAGLATALLLRRLCHRRYCRRPPMGRLIDAGETVRFFTINRDIFLRTLCIIAVTAFFTSYGAREGDLTLACNTILMQFFYLFSYVSDGFANAGEALSGRHYGAAAPKALTATLRRLFIWGAAIAAVFTVVYALWSEPLASLFTDDATVRIEMVRYLPWLCLVPFAGAAAFLWDGVFIGVTYTNGMLMSMAVATAAFFAIWAATHSWLGNHGLWLAFLSYLTLRGLVQTLLYPCIRHRLELRAAQR